MDQFPPHSTPAIASPRSVVDRRSFLRLTSGLAAAGTVQAVLSACTAIAPTSPTAVPTGTSAKGGAAAYPNYYPVTTGAKPDIAAAGPQYQSGFINYPKDPPKSWTKAPPGAGGTITSYTNTGAPLPPTPLDQNPAWQEVNKQLNATVQFQIIAQADYPTKLATMMAGNDLTDFILIGKGVQNLTPFLQAKCADLTPYLGGDAIKNYPNLAALPTYSWTNSACARNGKLYMVPIERYLPGNMLLKNNQVYYSEIGKDYTPKDADDFKRVLQALTKPDQNRYALAPITARTDMIDFFSSIFGAPKNWRLGSDGSLVRDVETQEFKDTIGYMRDLIVAGVFYPDASGIPNATVARDSFIATKFVLDNQSYGNAWQDDWLRGPQQNPPVVPGAVMPFPAHAVQQPMHHFGDGFYSTTTLKQASPDRIQELLRVLDWVAAPFGSQEDLLLTTGVPDRDYTIDSSGNPVPTKMSNLDANSVPWKYLTQHPQVAFWPGIPDYAQAAIDYEKAVIPIGVQDPTIGLSTPTLDKQGVPLLQTLQDGLFDLLTGRRPLSDYDQIVKDWQNGGGNQIRQELQQVIASNA
ncbi:MAG: extracellular solute-binding protein [Chloroflexi bacterium]|nr:extracellular solute-binding protein [Chloroflexota bacterium]